MYRLRAGSPYMLHRMHLRFITAPTRFLFWLRLNVKNYMTTAPIMPLSSYNVVNRSCLLGEVIEIPMEKGEEL